MELSKTWEFSKEEEEEYLSLEARTKEIKDGPGELLWHYGTWETLKGIAETRELWASHANYLNDSSELAYGLSSIVKQLEKYPALKTLRQFDFTAPKPSDSPYIVSLTAAFDSLSQWKGYAGATPSFAIALDQRALTENLKDFPVLLQRCIYDIDEINVALRPFEELLATRYARLDEEKARSDAAPPGGPGWTPRVRIDNARGIAKSAVLYRLLALAPTIKHPKFFEEREYRLVVDHSIAKREVLDRSNKAKGFHLKGTLVVPHATLPLEYTAKNERRDLPIVAVMVGPTAHPLLTVETVRQLLEPLEKKFAVTRTKIPFRNW